MTASEMKVDVENVVDDYAQKNDFLAAPGQDNMGMAEVEAEGQHEITYDPNPARTKVCVACFICSNNCICDPIDCWGCVEDYKCVCCLSVQQVGCKCKPDEHTIFLCCEGGCKLAKPEPVLCGGVRQCFCTETRGYLPPNKDAQIPSPPACALMGFMCYPKVGCCKSFADLGVISQKEKDKQAENAV